MEKIVFIGYKPFTGKEAELAALLEIHWQTLKIESLVTDRRPIIVKAEDETVIEVFGWKSKEAMDLAHSNKIVLDMWNEFSKVCEYVPVGELTEVKELFSEFKPLN